MENNNAKKNTNTRNMLDSLDAQYGYYDEQMQEEEKEQDDWLKGLIEYVKSRKQAQVQAVAK